MSRFPHFTFSGGPVERGLAYGETCRERIQATYALYAQSLFSSTQLSEDEFKRRAHRVRGLIENFDPRYVLEYDAVARGAALPDWQIYVLNARTEILNAPVAECTALYFADTSLLAQNWDWVAALEELAVLITWELDDARRVLTFTEPGMLGKIGLNDRGLGVCLNILFSKHELDGVPVHVLTRALLDCANVREARAMLARSGVGKSSHFLIGDANGNACSTEYAAGEVFEVDSESGDFLHTNHCLAPAALAKAAIIPTSAERYQQSATLLSRSRARDCEAMKSILLDDSAGSCSINMSYHPEALLDNRDVGTCATLVMDLPARTLLIKRGPGRTGEFFKVSV